MEIIENIPTRQKRAIDPQVITDIQSALGAKGIVKGNGVRIASGDDKSELLSYASAVLRSVTPTDKETKLTTPLKNGLLVGTTVKPDPDNDGHFVAYIVAKEA